MTRVDAPLFPTRTVARSTCQSHAASALVCVQADFSDCRNTRSKASPADDLIPDDAELSSLTSDSDSEDDALTTQLADLPTEIKSRVSFFVCVHDRE